MEKWVRKQVRCLMSRAGSLRFIFENMRANKEDFAFGVNIFEDYFVVIRIIHNRDHYFQSLHRRRCRRLLFQRSKKIIFLACPLYEMILWVSVAPRDYFSIFNCSKRFFLSVVAPRDYFSKFIVQEIIFQSSVAPRNYFSKCSRSKIWFSKNDFLSSGAPRDFFYL